MVIVDVQFGYQEVGTWFMFTGLQFLSGQMYFTRQIYILCFMAVFKFMVTPEKSGKIRQNQSFYN